MQPVGKSDSAGPNDRPLGQPLLRVEDLRVHFPITRGVFGRVVGLVRAVDGVGFEIAEGRTLGLVGESGCGKTTTGRAILRLLPATGGRVRFADADIFTLPARRMRALRREMQIIFQDPYGSLNPRMRVESIVGEPLAVHRLASGRRRRDQVADTLERVGIRAESMRCFPHEFSGGQRQRICIARAIIMRPKFIVCDECVSALDVSVQSQILNLLSDLRAELGLAYLFIAHNLAVVRHISDSVAVMYLGRIVETSATDELFNHPRHPYTRMLLASIPRIDAKERTASKTLLPVLGEAPSLSRVPAGCGFHPRCPLATDRCRTEAPALEGKPGLPPSHRVACHHAEDAPAWDVGA